VVPHRGPVDVTASERLLAQRPAESRGGKAKGPTAESTRPQGAERDVAAEIVDYESLRAHCQRAVAVYDAIIEDLRALPAGNTEADWCRVHANHQDTLCAALAPWL
jgi:hypothetical protein